MSLKRFNFEFSALSSEKSGLSAELEAHIHSLLGDSIANLQSEDISEHTEEIPTTLNNIYQLITRCEADSDITWKAVEMLEKMILAMKHRPNVINKSGFLPILTDVLLRYNIKVEYLLNLIQDITFGISIKCFETHIEQLMKYIINILVDESYEHDGKLRKVSLSVLINLCSKNFTSLSILRQEINLVDLQKKISIEKYGILACKLNLVLHDCGHLLRDVDIRNFLKYASKELVRIPTLDEKTLKHLIDFLRDVTHRRNTAQVIREYDFHAGLEAALRILENSQEIGSAVHINALFQVIQTVLEAQNNSLENVLFTALNFALINLKTMECAQQALETLNSIFTFDTKISTTHFELDELKQSLSMILSNKNRQKQTTISLLKLLSTLASNYKLDLVDKKTLKTILHPLLSVDNPKYGKMSDQDISIYLQCLATITTLTECQLIEIKPNVFSEKNVQYLIGMSIKHGNTDQCSLALSLLNKSTPIQSIAEVISASSPIEELNDTESFLQNKLNPPLAKDLSNDIGHKRIENVFYNIETACNKNDLNSIPASDFIDLYTNENAILKKQIDSMTNKLNALSKEIMIDKQDNIRLQTISLKWSELARNLQNSNELLSSDKDKLNVTLRNLREELTNLKSANIVTTKLLADEKKRSIDLEKRVKELEEELKDTEELRQNVLSLITKRKKGNR